MHLKSRLLAYGQCLKRLRLEVNHPQLQAGFAAIRVSFSAGYQLGGFALRLYSIFSSSKLKV